MSSNSSSGKNGNNGRDDRDDDDRRGDRDSHGNIIGTNCSDTLIGTDRNDTIKGRDGDDKLYGLAGNDEIDGGKGNDLIEGGSGNDRLNGGQGNDTLIGGSGNDHLNGGSGRDTAVFSGNYSDYTIKFSNSRNRCDNDDDTVKVARKVSGSPDGTDTLKNVEVLQFDDGYYQNGVFYPTGGNQAPVLTGSQAMLAGGTEDLAYTVSKADLLEGFTDVDGDALSVAGLTASNGTFVLNGDGSYTITPTADSNGLVTLNYTVTDGQGGNTATTQSFNLAAVNDAPVASSGLAGGDKNTDIVVQALVVDVDNAAVDLSYSVAIQPEHGTVTITDGTFTYTPFHDYIGPDSFSFTATDPGGAVSNVATIDLTVGSLIARFFVSKDVAEVSGQPAEVSGQLMTSNADGNALTYILETQASNGTADVDEFGVFTYVAKPGGFVVGSDSAMFLVTDVVTGDTTSSSVSITIRETGVNLSGTALADHLIAGPGGLELAGLGGADVLIGGAGTDTAVYSASLDGVTVNLSTNLNSGGDAAGDLLFEIESVVGSNGDDMLTARDPDPQPDPELPPDTSGNGLDGGDGDDTLVGGAGDDGLIGGLGTDILTGGKGNDSLWGGLGVDQLTGGTGSDQFFYFGVVEGGDTITDFTAGEGDALVLQDVLQDYDPSADDLADFITLVESEIAEGVFDTTVYVDADGTGGDHSFTALVTLQGVSGLNLESFLNENLLIF